MMKLGDRYTCEIAETTLLGGGFVSVDGFSVFVKNGVAGDYCTIEICELKKKYAIAELKELHSKSPYRCESDCSVCGECGGCVFRTVSEQHENEVKQAAVVTAFRRVGFNDLPCKDIIVPNPGRYRNKAVYHFSPDGRCGFYSSGSRKIIDGSTYSCRNVPEIFSAIADECSRYVRSHDTAEITELMLRVSTSGDIAVGITGGNGSYKDMAEYLLLKYPSVKGVSVNRGDGSYEPVAGEKYITVDLSGLSFRISPEAFFQVNYKGAEAILSAVKEASDGIKVGADLYCGTGIIGIALAAAIPEAEILGVEQNPSAVEDAKYNAMKNHVDNIRFLCGDAAKLIPRGSCDGIVVDPPRKGLSPRAVAGIAELSPEKIIYVSCNVHTLARDAVRFSEFGYSPESVQPINMFPRTEHMETVCSFKLAKDR